MRIWDVSPEVLCRNHLLGEHRELHAIWSILTQQKKGYSSHPETIRWKGKLKALYLRHELLVEEMQKRRYHHQSALNVSLATGESTQNILVDSIDKQMIILRQKQCKCKV